MENFNLDFLKIDLKSLIPYATEAFTAVYGEEYESRISRINDTIILQYHDVEGLEKYIEKIKKYKIYELSIEFLERIGIDVQKPKRASCITSLDDNLEEILEHYMGGVYQRFSENADYWTPLRAFDNNNNEDAEKLLENKIELINYLLGNEHDPITKENFNTFSQTEEYSKLLTNINEIKTIYEELFSKYRKWVVQFLPHEKYIEYETKRKKEILQEKKNEMFEEIYPSIPSPIKDALSNKSFMEQQNAVLGTKDIGSASFIEHFNSKHMEKLTSDDISEFEKFLIILKQSMYLRSLGIATPNLDKLDYDSKEEITSYLSFLNQDQIKEYIPSENLINYISSIREKKYEEALRKYYTTRIDFTDIIKRIGDSPNNIEALYHTFKNQHTCISFSGATSSNGKFLSIMLYTITESMIGALFYVFMHEAGHAIDQTEEGIGFELNEDLRDDAPRNPYNKQNRMHERFNETINDIFTMEAYEYLRNKGIYLIEPPKYTLSESDLRNRNTSKIIKDLLQPLITRFRDQVIKAKVNTKPKELTKYIGEDNFEDLNDAINKIDNLIDKGVQQKLIESIDDDMVREYYEQLERVKQIYASIDDYYDTNFGALSPSSYGSPKI